jgi:hypothetical protein
MRLGREVASAVDGFDAERLPKQIEKLIAKSCGGQRGIAGNLSTLFRQPSAPVVRTLSGKDFLAYVFVHHHALPSALTIDSRRPFWLPC